MGNMKGIEFRNIYKRNIKKLEYEGALDGIVSEDILKEQMLEAFSDCKNKGRIYAFYKKKKMVACYIICNVPLVEGQSDKDNKSKEKRIYELRYHYVTEEFGHLKEEMEKCVFAELKELALIYDIENIIWGDKIFGKRKVKLGNRFVSVVSFAVIMSSIFGILFDNIPLGMCIGISFAMSFGYVLFPTKSIELEEKEREDNAIN